MCEFSSCAQALASLKPQNGIKKLLKLHETICNVVFLKIKINMNFLYNVKNYQKRNWQTFFSVFLYTTVEFDFALDISFTFWIHANKFLDQSFEKALFFSSPLKYAIFVKYDFDFEEHKTNCQFQFKYDLNLSKSLTWFVVYLVSIKLTGSGLLRKLELHV